MQTRYRKRINEKIDEKLLNDLNLISKTIDLPKSRILEDGISYILKKGICPLEKQANRRSINLTINFELWNNLKQYSEINNYKIVHLLETALKYSIKKYKRKIKSD